MMRRIVIIFVITFSLIFTACQSGKDTPKLEKNIEKNTEKQSNTPVPKQEHNWNGQYESTDGNCSLTITNFNKEDFKFSIMAVSSNGNTGDMENTAKFSQENMAVFDDENGYKLHFEWKKESIIITEEIKEGMVNPYGGAGVSFQGEYHRKDETVQEKENIDKPKNQETVKVKEKEKVIPKKDEVNQEKEYKGNRKEEKGITQLSKTEQDFFTRFFSEKANNGFLLSNYDKASEIDLNMVLYNGAGLKEHKLGVEEKNAYLKVTGHKEIASDIEVLTIGQINDFLGNKLELSLYDITKKFDWVYVPKYESYYFEHGDTNFCSLQCKGGTKTDRNLYVIKMEAPKDAGVQAVTKCTVTLQKMGEDYVFLSNKIE